MRNLSFLQVPKPRLKLSCHLDSADLVGVQILSVFKRRLRVDTSWPPWNGHDARRIAPAPFVAPKFSRIIDPARTSYWLPIALRSSFENVGMLALWDLRSMKDFYIQRPDAHHDKNMHSSANRLHCKFVGIYFVLVKTNFVASSWTSGSKAMRRPFPEGSVFGIDARGHRTCVQRHSRRFCPWKISNQSHREVGICAVSVKALDSKALTKSSLSRSLKRTLLATLGSCLARRFTSGEQNNC